MMQLKTVTNATKGEMLEQHTLEIPPCCPVSKNPRPGSTLTISYHPIGASLEIASLLAYLHSFRGGLRNDLGELEVRDMEGMICRIAADCSEALQIPVKVEAELQVLPRQEMRLSIAHSGS